MLIEFDNIRKCLVNRPEAYLTVRRHMYLPGEWVAEIVNGSRDRLGSYAADSTPAAALVALNQLMAEEEEAK